MFYEVHILFHSNLMKIFQNPDQLNKNTKLKLIPILVLDHKTKIMDLDYPAKNPTHSLKIPNFRVELSRRDIDKIPSDLL